jgi:hypothetical protein
MECWSVARQVGEFGKTHFPTTLSFAPLHDHKRLPGRFHARLTGADDSDLG